MFIFIIFPQHFKIKIIIIEFKNNIITHNSCFIKKYASKKMANLHKNIWDQMAIFNNLTLKNTIYGFVELGTLKLRAAVVALNYKQI